MIITDNEGKNHECMNAFVCSVGKRNCSECHANPDSIDIHESAEEKLQRENNNLRSQLATFKQERDAAITESNRRDQKWMDGIDAIVGKKLNYHEPFVPGGITLEGYISELKLSITQAEHDRDEYEKLLIEKDRDYLGMMAERNSYYAELEETQQERDVARAGLGKATEIIQQLANHTPGLVIDSYLTDFLADPSATAALEEWRAMRGEKSKLSNATRAMYNICSSCPNYSVVAKGCANDKEKCWIKTIREAMNS